MELSDEVLEWYAMKLFDILYNPEYDAPKTNPTIEERDWEILYPLESRRGELKFD